MESFEAPHRSAHFRACQDVGDHSRPDGLQLDPLSGLFAPFVLGELSADLLSSRNAARRTPWPTLSFALECVMPATLLCERLSSIEVQHDEESERRVA